MQTQGFASLSDLADSLSVSDFEKILVATDAALTKQYQALLATEDVKVEFAPEGIGRLAQIAFAVTEQTGEGTKATAAQVRELSRMAEELSQSVSRFKIA